MASQDGTIDGQKLMDEILTTIHNADQERDSFEKISRVKKAEYKNQKIEIENQFSMIINMLKATECQLLNQLEEKHKSQQYELNGKINKLFNFTKKFRAEYNESNKENITQIADIHDRITAEIADINKNEKYINKNINVIIDTSSIMKSIQKIAYIQEKTKEEMSKQQQFEFHDDNKNLCVKPEIIALNTNSMNTKICVSWKLQPVRSNIINGDNGDNGDNTDNGDNLDNKTAENDEDDPGTPTIESDRNSRHSISMTDDIDTSNMTMNVHEICSIDIEWRYSNDKEEIVNKNKDKNKRKHEWNILDVEHHKILAFNLDKSIFDHILNTSRYGIYYFRITLYNRNSRISSKQSMITTFKINIRHIADEWNLERKQKELRIGFFNRKIVTRDIPGKFRHIFGTLIVSKGVNVWTLKIKKCDPNRQKCSSMIGLINMNNRNNVKSMHLKTLNQCFAHIGIGYGIFTSNGDVYHTKQPRTFGKEIKENDIIQIMADFRAQTMSFIINNINWGIAWNRNHFPKQKMPNLGLAVALRGCDEIQLIDFVNEAQSIFPQNKRRRRSSSTSLQKMKPISPKIHGPEKYGKLKLEKRDSGNQETGTPPPAETK